MTKNSINNTSSDLQVSAINLAGSTISTTTTNTNLNLVPNGTGKVSISGAYTLPNADGTSGQYLQTNGTTNLSFNTFPAFFKSLNVQTFTSSGTYTPTAGMVFCEIECIGGGGGGGGSEATGLLEMSGGAGGSSGSYSKGLFTAADIGVSKTVTIGAAGSGGIGSSLTDGTDGGTTSVGVLITALGGKGATTGTVRTNVLYVSPTTATIGAGGNLNLYGGTGSYCLGISDSVNFAALSGFGGSSFYGGGALGVAGGQVTLFDYVGQNATSPGGGGGGAVCMPSTIALNGGNGASGMVIITEYIV